jgi:ABC-type phosphate transport system substrate-binding protein
MKFYPLVLALGMLSMLLSVTAASWKDVSPTKIGVIINAENPTASLSPQDIRTYYLTAINKTWPATQQPVVPVSRQQTCMENELFSARILQMPAEDALKYCFSKPYATLKGQGRSFNSDTDIVDYVATTPGAIGYVNLNSLKTSASAKVKVVLTLSK